MQEYEAIQNRKLISAYGGVGSIVETREGAVIVLPFNEWPFWKTKEFRQRQYRIDDSRFIRRLQALFPDLQEIVSIPENEMDNFGNARSSRKLAAAAYFPQWMYCTTCHTLDKHPSWQQKWKDTVREYDKDKFLPPKCSHCYNNNKIQGNFHRLEQVRFVMTSPSGAIVDVPWDYWLMRPQKNTDAEGNKQETLDLQEINIPKGLSLRYITSSKFSDLKGIRVEGYVDGKLIKKTSLSGLFSLRAWENQHPDISFHERAQLKVVLRSSNSIYYPNISQSIYLPEENEISQTIIDTIKSIKDDFGIEDPIKIGNFLKKRENLDIAISVIENIIADEDSNTPITIISEEQYRLEEFQFFTEKGSFNHPDLAFDTVDQEYIQESKVQNIYKVDRLKVTMCQTSYTRQQPIDKDSYLEQSLDGDIKRRYTSSFKERATHLPAYENYGEGIFIVLDLARLQKWSKEIKVIERAQWLQENYNNSFLGQDRQKQISPSFVLVHTLSHLLIKELEFLCGYPAASLQERLYNSKQMCGLLLYTVAGAEGSYGGLVSLCQSDKIGTLIKSALHRAKDCASDPICYDTDQQGQGTAGLNLAACYSCGLLPETSCEEMNAFLDRRLLIDEFFGFFS